MKIAVILVQPENPDNIGAVARAMKNMGFQDLVLVKPPPEWKIKARTMAMGGKSVLDRAQVLETFKEAIQDSHLVVGTTRRRGRKRGAFLDFHYAIRRIRTVATEKKVSIVFGKESKGLDNATLRDCDFLMSLPTHPSCPSINLAQAVMITAFSLFQTKPGSKLSYPKEVGGFVNKQEIGSTLRSFEKALLALGYDRSGERIIHRIVATLHRLIKRAGLLKSEAQMLKGISRRICEKTLEALPT